MPEQVELDDGVHLGPVLACQRRHRVVALDPDQHAVNRRNHDHLAMLKEVDGAGIRPNQRVHGKAVLGRQGAQGVPIGRAIGQDRPVLLFDPSRGQ